MTSENNARHQNISDWMNVAGVMSGATFTMFALVVTFLIPGTGIGKTYFTLLGGKIDHLFHIGIIYGLL
ncbi:MAG: hypothetical protein ACFFC7_03545 [Candidatus Hermodarchaeota archaeon]